MNLAKAVIDAMTDAVFAKEGAERERVAALCEQLLMVLAINKQMLAMVTAETVVPHVDTAEVHRLMALVSSSMDRLAVMEEHLG